MSIDEHAVAHELDPGSLEDGVESPRVTRVDTGGAHRPGEGAIERAGIDQPIAQALCQRPRRGRLARACRAVDGDHQLLRGAALHSAAPARRRCSTSMTWIFTACPPGRGECGPARLRWR